MGNTAASGAVGNKAVGLARIAQQAVACEAPMPSEQECLRLVHNFASIRPPKWDTTVGLVILQNAGAGGYSVKPGNITMNMRKLVTALSQAALATAAAFKAPWLAIFGAITLWNSLYAHAKVDLSEKEASVLWTMWRLKDEENTVAKDGLLESINDERRKYDRGPLTMGDLRDALRKLEGIQTIERFTKFGSRWWLREWVSVKY